MRRITCLHVLVPVLFVAILIGIHPALSAAQTSERTGLPALVLLVRHAEKAAEPADDPPLTAAGAERAQALATALQDAGVTAIITTQLRRTCETAQPLATARGLPPETERGLLGDRAYALVDRAAGKAATAKNPRKWPRLFDFRATFIAPAHTAAPVPPVRIALPDGTTVTSDQGDLNQLLTQALNREVTLRAAQRGTVTAEEYWPDIEGLDHRDTVTDFTLPEGTFFDVAMVHLLTTATLDRLRELYPQGRFEVRRFRPNIVVQLASGEKGFAENAWVGHTLAIGTAVRLHITGPCGRCVMTTLAQGDLVREPGILRTAAQHNQGNVGVYAAVVQGGTIRRGDPVRMA